MTRSQLLRPFRLPVLAFVLSLASAAAFAGTATFSVGLDTDNNVATGCTFATANGPAAGIELVVNTIVGTTVNGASVTRVERQTCVNGVLGAPVTYDSGGWPVGFGNGTNGNAVVETSVPLSLLPPGATVRALALGNDGAGGQDATAPFTFTLLPAAGPAPAAVDVPLSPWLIVPLALALFALTTWLRRRYPGQTALVVVLVVFTVSGLAWAATVFRDGNIGDWNGVAPAVTDAAGDAPGNADIVAVFQQQDGANLYFRIDADIRKDAATNQQPVVGAGNNQTITLPASANLAGTATDDGLPNPPGALTLTWSKFSGPGTVSFGNASLASTTATFSAPGTYVLTLSAFDGALTGSATVTITVNAGGGGANQPPVVNAGANQSITLPNAATLSGTATDDGLPAPPASLAIAWTVDSGPGSVTFGNPAQPATSATFSAPGVYMLRLNANDGALAVSSTVQVTVTDGAPALAAIADRTINVGERLQVLLEAKDGNANDVLAYALPTAPAGASLNPAPLIDWIPTAAQVGTHPFTAKVTDGGGKFATVSFNVTVVQVNHPPQLGPQASLTLGVGTPFARTLSATDPDAGDTLTFALVSGPNGMALTGADLAWSTSGRNPGDYAVTVKVTDTGGLSNQRAFTLTLQASAAPIAVDDEYTVKPGATLTVPAPGVLANDVDASGNGMTATKVTDPTKGTLSAFDANGSFTFVAPNNVPAQPSLKATPLWGAIIYDNTGYSQAADLNHDGGADVVVISYGTPYAFDGKTGASLWSSWDRSATSLGKNCETYLVATDFALGDVDGSGNILYVAGANCDAHAAGPATRVIGVDTDPAHAVGGAAAVKWVSERLDVQVPLPPSVGAPPVLTYLLNPVGEGLASYATPTLAKLTPGGSAKVLTRYLIGTGMFPYDSDGDGTRESTASCYAATGNIADNGKACGVTFVLDAATGVKELVLTAPNPYNQYESPERTPYRQLPPVVADLDGDGQVEIISGTDVFKYDGTKWSLAWQAALPGVTIFYEPFSISVADLDGDGTAEVVLHTAWYDGTGYHRGFLTYRHDGVLLHRFEVPMWDTGPVTIADVDGDGIPELLLVGRGLVWAYHADGTLVWASAIPDDDLALHPDDDPAVIHLPKPTGERTGAGNGLQVYDLDLDGHPEVIASGLHRMAIYDGRTGAIKSSMHNNAYVRTNIVPLVVDANGDGHAEAVSPAGNPGICGGCPGTNILAFSGVDRDWAPAPLVQNQMNLNPWAVNNSGGILYDGGVHRSFRTQRQLGTVVDPRTRDTATFTYAAVGVGGASAPATVSVRVMPQNSPPVITSVPPTALYAVANGQGQFPTFLYQVAATDPDVGDTVHYELAYSTINTAYFAQATVDPLTGVVRMYTGPCGGGGCDFGLLTFIVAAVDSFGARTEQGFVVDVTTQSRTVPDVVGQLQRPAKDAVEAMQLAPRVVEVFDARPVGSVVAQDPAAGTVVARNSTVLLSVSKGLQPIPMPFVVGKQLALANAILASAGLSVNVSTTFSTTIPAGEVMTQSPAFGTLLDPATATPVDLTVSAGAALPAPVASIVLEPGPGPLTRLAGEDQQFKAVAILTDGTSADVTVTAAWSTTNAAAATVNAAGLVHAKAGGAATITATLSGKSSSVTVNVAPLVPGDNTPPTAAITSPADGGDVIVPTAIVGTAGDADFLRYELAIALAGDDNFTLLAEGTTAVTNGTLATLDPTTLVNNLYTLRLTVFDKGQNQSVATRTVQVRGSRKIGLFTLIFQDLNVAASGLPLTITRTYDSRDKTQGDFGIGWRLGQQTLRLRTNRVLGTGWVRNVAGPVVSLVPLSEHKVSITMPDGKVEEFDMVVSPTSNLGSLDFTNVTGFQPRPGTLGQLEALANNSLLIVNGGAEEELVDDNTLATYNPQLYRYTTVDGTQLEVSPGAGVKKITDRNGNIVTFGPAGILHSDGTGIQFARDAKGRIAAITDPSGNTQTYAYDGNGDLVQFTNAAGGVTKFAYDRGHNVLDYQGPDGNHGVRNDYDAAGRLVATTDARGNKLTFDHDIGASREILTNRLGAQTVVDYDASGRVLAETDALGGVTLFTYDARDNRLTETDPVGRVATKTYDARNDILTRTDFNGNTTTFTYNAFGQKLTTTDPEGHVTTNVYDAKGNLTQVTDSEGGVTKYTYSAAGNALTMVDPLGKVTTFTYDGAGNKTSQTDPLGRTTTYSYDANHRETGSTDPSGKQEQTHYDAMGRVVAKVDKLGNTSAVTYSLVANGQRIASRTGPGNRVTAFEYDAAGNLTKTTHPDGTTETTTYDAENHPLTKTDRAGAVTMLQYDSLGREVRKTFADGAFTTRTYDAAGRVLTRTNERGNTITNAYGPNTETVTDALGNVTVHTFDSNARRSRTLDALGRLTKFDYDGAGNLVKTTAPDGMFETTVYDAARRKIAVTDRAGKTTQFAYDSAGQLTSVTDAVGGVTAQTYDAAGNRISQTDASGRTTLMTYDAAGHLSSRTRPSGRQETFAYDAYGNAIVHTDFNGKTVTMVYDVMNRLVQKNLPGASSVAYMYTATGLRKQAGGDSTAYDVRGRVTKDTKASGETISYAYDAAGNKTAVMTPKGTTSYTYDAQERIATVVDPTGTTTYGYDAVGNLQSTASPNGVTAGYTYDTLNRLTKVTNTGFGGLVSSYAYTVGPAGNRLQVIEAGPATAQRTITYAYDALYRLTSEGIAEAGQPNQAFTYLYDAVGNRTRMVRNAVVTDYTYDVDDRMVTEVNGGTTTTAAYDNNGNIVSRSGGGVTESYDYDAENRMVTAVTPGGLVSFTYDVDGLRTSRTAGGAITTFLVDKNLKNAQVLVETTGGNAVVYHYGHQLISQVRPGNAVFFYLTDGQLSTRQLTNAAGAVTDQYTFDAFGRLLASTGATPNAFLYTGAQLDPNVGFYYLRARYYDPQRGRFFSTDPEEGSIYDPMSLHRYLYANANPLTYFDPSGEQIETLIAVFAVLATADAVIGAITAAVTNITLKGAPTGFKKASTFVVETAVGGINGGVSAIPVLGPLIAGVITVIKDVFINHYIAKQNISWNELKSSIEINFFIGGVVGIGLQVVGGDVAQSIIAGGGGQNLMRMVGSGIALLMGTTTSGLEEFLKNGFAAGLDSPFWCRKDYVPYGLVSTIKKCK